MALEWHSDVRRWYANGKPVHAGTALCIVAKSTGDEIDDPAAWPWEEVRIESRDSGRKLIAHQTVAGLEWTALVASAPYVEQAGHHAPLQEESSAWSTVYVAWPEELQHPRDRGRKVLR